MRTDGVVTWPPARLGATLDAAKRTGPWRGGSAMAALYLRRLIS
jgi:hypothetical protein